MINRFRVVVPNILYRGSAPSSLDVLELKNKFGIKKIVSLDEESGNKIDRTCKILGIKHVKAYITYTRKSLLDFLHHDLKELLLENGPTFLHCMHGKDRTGLACALVKCKYFGYSPEKAIEEAKSLGFGIGVPKKVVDLYEKIIRSCESKDNNDADIVSNERSYIGDNRDSYSDQSDRGSFAPYLDSTVQYPANSVYNHVNDQSPTRENYQSYRDSKLNLDGVVEDEVPLVGIFNNDAGMQGAGPAEPAGGFLYDQA